MKSYSILSSIKKDSNGFKETVRKGSVTFNDRSKLNCAFDDIITQSQNMKESLLMAQRASESDSTVLLRGESGTGKEMVAKAIHKASKRSNAPFVAVNCAAIPSTLLESELFGHEQGSFTGAFRRKLGKFEQADGGTIFFDEIGDMSPEMQIKILRVLQEREFERIGGFETIRCNVRIISATHRNLEEAITKETFREDLYYRLNVIPIFLPPLRERKEDIPELVEHFMQKLQKRIATNVKSMSDKVLNYFYNYYWPGNIREMENLIERLLVLCSGERVDYEELMIYIKNENGYGKRESYQLLLNLNEDDEIAKLEDYEKEILRFALKRFGSFNATGKALGITHKTVAYKAKKYNLIY
jgi:transcriptional regulator with PAS, ATPase and Fis domain